MRLKFHKILAKNVQYEIYYEIGFGPAKKCLLFRILWSASR